VTVEDDKPHKQINDSSTLGKIGEQAVALLLTRAHLNVQNVSNENDIGRDLYVDVVRDRSITGGVVAIQVRSIKKPRSDESAGCFLTTIRTVPYGSRVTCQCLAFFTASKTRVCGG
jgi:hypothetical protein